MYTRTFSWNKNYLYVIWFTSWVLHVSCDISSTELHNGMDIIRKEIRCSAEWKNRSLSMPWRSTGKQTSGFIQRQLVANSSSNLIGFFFKLESQLSVTWAAELESALNCRSSGKFPNKQFHAVLLVHLISETVVLLEGTPKNRHSVLKN